MDIAGDKKMTNRLLGSAGLPVPRSEVVRDRGRCRRGREADRVPRRDEAARRQPRPRGRAGHPHANARSAPGSSARSRSAQRPRRGGELRHGQRLPRARDRRAHGRDRGAGPGARDRRREAHGRASWSRQTNQDPRRGIGHEKVLTRIKIDDAATRPREEAGVRDRGRPPEGRAGEARGHRQHVDGRHLDRPDVGRPRGQRGDRRGGGARRRPGRRRHRLPGARHLRAGARDGRGDRRGERRAGVPDAHPSHRGRAAVRGQAVVDLLFPPGSPSADPDPRGDRLQRQDDHHAHDRAHLPRDGPARSA